MRKRTIAVIVFLAFLLGSIVGCGRKTAEDGLIEVEVTGTVALPDNSSIELKDLSIVTCAGREDIASDGSFTAKEPGAGAAMAFITDEDGSPLLAGFVDGSGEGGNRLDAKSTAVILLFQALSAYTLPRDTWPQIISLLEAHPAAAKLTESINERFAEDPQFIGNQDPVVIAALQDAVEAINVEIDEGAAAMEAAAEGSVQQAVGGIEAQPTVTAASALTLSTLEYLGKTASFEVVADASGDTPAQVTVEPSAEISGIRVAPNADGNGITITNNMRRHLWAYVYKTGWKTKDDDENTPPRQISPWEPLDETGTYIQAVNGYQGYFGSIADIVLGQGVYKPVTSDAIILPVEPEEAVRTYYKIIVVGPAWTEKSFESELPSGYASNKYATTWKQAEEKMDALTLFQELVFPAILTIFPKEALSGESLDGKKAINLVTDCTKIISNAFPQIIEQIASDDYKGVLATTIKAFESDTLRDQLLQKLKDAGEVKPSALSIAGSCLEKLNAITSSIDKFLSVGDLGAVVKQLCSAKQFVDWSGTAMDAYIRIQSNPSVVALGEDVTLTCFGSAGIAGNKEYEWDTTALHGHIEDSHGNSGAYFFSSDQSVRYVPDANAADGDEDTVTVKVYLNTNGKREELGSAEASVTITDQERTVAFSPAAPQADPGDAVRIDASVLPAFPDDVQVQIDWTCTNQYGTIAGPNGETALITSAYIVYTAGETEGSDTVTAKVWRLNSGGKRVPVCTGTVTVNGSNVRFIHMSSPTITTQNGTESSTVLGHDALMLVFPRVEGATRYYLTWHWNGCEVPASAGQYLLAYMSWDELIDFMTQTGLDTASANMYAKSIISPFRQDGEREEVFPVDTAIDNSGLFEPGEVMVPVITFWCDVPEGDSAGYQNWLAPRDEIIEIMMNWTAELEIE
jgi:hypothetical protein